MGLFSRKNRQSDTAVADRRPELNEAERLKSEGRLFEAIDLLTEANRKDRDVELEREMRTVRHLAGIELLENAPEGPVYPDPGRDRAGAGRAVPLSRDHPGRTHPGTGPRFLPRGRMPARA